MCSKMRFHGPHLLWPCLEHLLNALAPQNSPAGPTATWEAHSRSHTSDPLGLTEWNHVIAEAQGELRSSGWTVFFRPNLREILDRCPVIWHFKSVRLGPIEIWLNCLNPAAGVWSNILFWKRSETRDWEAALIKTTKYWNTRSIFWSWTYAKTTDHADKMLHERTFHHCFGQRSSASSKRLLAAISLVSGCLHETIDAQRWLGLFLQASISMECDLTFATLIAIKLRWEQKNHFSK